MKTKAYFLIFAILVATAADSIAKPSISLQPANQTVNQGFNATFRVTGSGVPPLSYQWYFNSNALPWATTKVLTITNAQPVDAGAYAAVATDLAGSVTSRVARLTVVLPAPLDPKVGPNIRLGDDSALLPGPNQGEIHIARSYTAPNTLLVTFQDGSGPIPLVPPACTYATSTDGGVTWRRAFIPGLTKTTGGTDDFGADNVAVFDAQGNPSIASLRGPSTPVEYVRQVVVNRSFDGGQNFGAPLVAVTGTASDIPDKEWIAINTFPGVPHANRIALAYERGNFSMDGYSIYSDDGGITWSKPRSLGPLTLGMQNLFLPDGSLAVLYWHFVNGAYDDGPQRMMLVLSKDGGATFGAPSLVMDTSNFLHSDNTIWASRFFPSACADRQAGVIYLTFGAHTGPAQTADSRIIFTKSIDQGKTWSAPLKVNDTPPGRTVGIPAIAVSPDGQHVMIEFYDKRNDPGTTYLVDLYLAESFDGGDTWEPNLRLSEFSSDIRNAPHAADGVQYFLGDYQGIAPSLNFDTPAVAAWIDTRAGNNDPYVVRINRTKGTTFDAWRKLRFSTNDLANAAISGMNADPDGDGIPNLAEYAFGLEPRRSNSNPFTITREARDPNSASVVAYEKLGVLGDIELAWETSRDLAAWIPVTPMSNRVTAGRDPSYQRVETSFSTLEEKQFFRLRVNLKQAAP